MSDYIERDAVKQMINRWADGYSYIEVPTEWAEDEVRKIPAADVVEARNGKWIEENTRPRSSQFCCPVCHRTAYDPQPTRVKDWKKRCRYAYCPNCGAKMDGGAK